MRSLIVYVTRAPSSIERTAAKCSRQGSSRYWLIFGSFSTIGWSSGTLQSSTRSGFVEQRGQHLQHFRIAQRRLTTRARRPNDLGANLVELPISSLLRPLTTKLWADVIQLLQRALLVETMLDVRAHHASSVLGTQRQRLRLLALGAGLVLPSEHLFGNDVGLFAHAAREQLRVFENRRPDLVIVVAREDVAHLRVHPVP